MTRARAKMRGRPGRGMPSARGTPKAGSPWRALRYQRPFGMDRPIRRSLRYADPFGVRFTLETNDVRISSYALGSAGVCVSSASVVCAASLCSRRQVPNLGCELLVVHPLDEALRHAARTKRSRSAHNHPGDEASFGSVQEPHLSPNRALDVSDFHIFRTQNGPCFLAIASKLPKRSFKRS